MRAFLAAVLIASLGLAACATRPLSPVDPVGTITLKDAFKGSVTGKGRFQVPLAGVDRAFTAKLSGIMAGETLEVTEDFVFADGESNTLHWHFTPNGPGRWTGVREDTVGTAQITENGQEIRLEYTADAQSRGTTNRLDFSDVIYRRADGVVVNNAVVKKFGFAIGSIHLQFGHE